jgi:hypothetical protein
MPWRGPQERGEFPTLGYSLGEWIEANLIVPDGERMGQPYLLTDEMWRFLLWLYRLRPDATADMGSEAFVYYGAQLIRPQKWGKDPFAAALVNAHALGEDQFAGWDAYGEPVARPHPSPWVQCVATSEDQTANTFAPIVTMLRDGPLADTPGLDVGETRIKLPGVGWIEPATSSGRARLGARLSMATFTESHLMVESNGGVLLAKNMKRNIAGMGGRWIEITNAWDPAEQSVAQRTNKAKAPGVYIDYRPPRVRVDLEDDAAVLEEIRYVYGDSIRSRGGWVREGRILADIRDESTGENEARRYFLNETTGGIQDAVDAIKWAALARPGEVLAGGARVALGFDGSRNLDATSLVACRDDGRLFHLRTWERPRDAKPDWKVPRGEVDQAVRDAFEAYEVGYLYADPYRWQDYIDAWSALWPDKIVEFPTNVEIRMDRAIERFITAYRNKELTHDGDELLARHAGNAALAKGKRKPPRENSGIPEFYLKVVKKKQGHWIDTFVAAILAYHARGKAIEDDVWQAEPVEPWGAYV